MIIYTNCSEAAVRTLMRLAPTLSEEQEVVFAESIVQTPRHGVLVWDMSTASEDDVSRIEVPAILRMSQVWSLVGTTFSLVHMSESLNINVGFNNLNEHLRSLTLLRFSLDGGDTMKVESNTFDALTAFLSIEFTQGPDRFNFKRQGVVQVNGAELRVETQIVPKITQWAASWPADTAEVDALLEDVARQQYESAEASYGALEDPFSLSKEQVYRLNELRKLCDWRPKEVDL